MANFYRRPIEDNEWHPVVGEVDFTDIMLKKIGELAATGVEVWTAWAQLDEVEDADPPMPEVEFQVTQDNCRVAISTLDDDADTIMLKDPRDGLWFRYARFETDEDVFNWCAETVMTWAINIGSLVPLEDNYKPVLERMSGDVEDFEIPDEWLAD